MRAVVIGGGMIGLMSAYHLHEAGLDVVIVDARSTGQGASDVNAGWFCPAESAPVPGPGIVGKSLKWMLHPDSPLYIKPSLQPTFIKFMLQMWRHCNASDQQRGLEASIRLVGDSAELYKKYQREMKFELHSEGLLSVFLEKKNFDSYSENLEILKRYDLDPQVLLGDQVREYEPLLSDNVYAGVMFPHEMHVDPGSMMAGFKSHLRFLGVTIIEDCAITDVERRGRQILSVNGDGTKLEADIFLLATGAWTGKLSKIFSLNLPVRPGKGYSLQVEPYPLRGATNLSDAKVALTPLQSHLRLAGTMEFGGLDESINQVRVDAIRRAPHHYLRNWVDRPLRIAARAGMRPMTPDGLPLIGKLAAFDNGWISTGHGMMGITLGAGSARALAQAILDNHLPSTLHPFSPARFKA
jgi:D-amino-acid dehydrogenase